MGLEMIGRLIGTSCLVVCRPVFISKEMEVAMVCTVQGKAAVLSPTWIYLYAVRQKKVVRIGLRCVRQLGGGNGQQGAAEQAYTISVTLLSPPPTSEYPVWIKKLIMEVESYPAQDPRVSLTQYEYKNQIVYYLPAYQCCDFFSSLYNESGDVICAPDGGFTGRGDGRCSDFFTIRQNGKVIWQDPR